MEYITSLLEEYYGLSKALDEGTTRLGDAQAIEQLLTIEEEICWEVPLPISEGNRNLFRLIEKEKSISTYVQDSIKKLEEARLQYAYDRRSFNSNLEHAA